MPTGYPNTPRPVKLVRTCSECKEDKPNTTDFFPRRSQKRWKLGLQSYCHDCHSRRTRRQHAQRRLEVLQHYSGSERPFCSCCGESHIEFLGIDHVNGGGSKHRRAGRSATSIAIWLKRHGYPKGYRVLCHNCNLAIGFYGKCPHQEPSITTASSEGISH